jgi:hypothetical protein
MSFAVSTKPVPAIAVLRHRLLRLRGVRIVDHPLLKAHQLPVTRAYWA